MNAQVLVDLGFAHFWQLSLVVAVATVVTRTLAPRHPHLLYLLWLLVIAKCLTPAVWDSPTGVFSWVHAKGPGAGTPTATRSLETRAEAPADSVARPIDQRPRPVDTSPPMVAEKSPPAATVAQTDEGLLRPAGIGWPGTVVAIWLVGVVAMAVTCAVNWLTCWWIIHRHGTAAEGALRNRMTTLARRVGMKRFVPRLIVLDRPLGPATIGLLRPTVLLPRQLCDVASAVEIDAVIAHELVHVRRCDVVAAWLQVFAVILWWFYPLVWWANRQVSRWREAVCDDEVLANFGIPARVYSDALLRVLDLRVVPPAGLQLSMAASELTKSRLQRIMTPRVPRRRTPAWCWALFAIAALAVLPGAGGRWGARSATETPDREVAAAPIPGEDRTSEPEPSESPGESRDVASMNKFMSVFRGGFGSPTEVAEATRGAEEGAESIRVEIKGRAVDGKGDPIGGATVHLVRQRPDGSVQTRDTETDVTGRFDFPDLSFGEWRDGFDDITLIGDVVGHGLFWQRRRVTIKTTGVTLEPIRAEDAAGNRLMRRFASLIATQPKVDSAPVSLELKASDAKTVSGRVVDDSGHPISEMEIRVTEIGRPDAAHLALRVVDAGALGLKTRSDAGGNWEFTRIPSGCWVRLHLSHPSYPTWETAIAVDPSARIIAAGAIPMPVSPAELRLPTACEVTVVVRDEREGRPVPGTKVTGRHLRGHLILTVAATTDDAGRATLRLPPGGYYVHLEPPFSAEIPTIPSSVMLIVRPDEPRQFSDLILRSGCHVDVNVVSDTTGLPVPGITVRAKPDPTDRRSFLYWFGGHHTDPSGRIQAIVEPGQSCPSNLGLIVFSYDVPQISRNVKSAMDTQTAGSRWKRRAGLPVLRSSFCVVGDHFCRPLPP